MKISPLILASRIWTLVEEFSVVSGSIDTSAVEWEYRAF
jgi:hypothetical protein